MSRLTDLGRNVACYFGLAEGTPPTSDADRQRLWVDMLRVAGVLAIAYTIAAILGVSDDLWATLGLVVAVAFVLGLIHRALVSRGST